MFSVSFSTILKVNNFLQTRLIFEFLLLINQKKSFQNISYSSVLQFLSLFFIRFFR
ncbi:hypothetical protein ACINWCA92_1433 [Acinetobacter baumannii WC-A-92]|nr:hypothetical protein ACINWCA92_1433 [Acinetobacter baumannii WC-A-92]